MKIGSLFTGLGGLELGVCDVVTSIAPYGNDIEWIAETNGNALKILDHSTMFHGVPNLGDVAKIDWSAAPDVDCITGGTPCQDFSHLGSELGLTHGYAACRPPIGPAWTAGKAPGTPSAHPSTTSSIGAKTK